MGQKSNEETKKSGPPLEQISLQTTFLFTECACWLNPRQVREGSEPELVPAETSSSAVWLSGWCGQMEKLILLDVNAALLLLTYLLFTDLIIQYNSVPQSLPTDHWVPQIMRGGGGVTGGKERGLRRPKSLGSDPSSASSSLSHSFFISRDGIKTPTVSGCCEG